MQVVLLLIARRRQWCTGALRANSQGIRAQALTAAASRAAAAESGVPVQYEQRVGAAEAVYQCSMSKQSGGATVCGPATGGAGAADGAHSGERRPQQAAQERRLHAPELRVARLARQRRVQLLDVVASCATAWTGVGGSGERGRGERESGGGEEGGRRGAGGRGRGERRDVSTRVSRRIYE